MDSLRDYLILLGEEVSGNYDVLELLRKQVQDIVQDNSDPLQKLQNMKITIFSCREKAANRAVDQIMKRNSLLQLMFVRVIVLQIKRRHMLEIPIYQLWLRHVSPMP